MPKTILVPLDGSRLAEGALPLAAALARALHAQTLLVQAVRAYGLTGPSLAELQARLTADALAYLEPLAEGLRAQGIPTQVCVPAELAEDGILAEVEARDADLIVMTTHGRSGLGRWLYGSVAESVLARSPVPVVLVRASAELADAPALTTPRILVPLDGSFFAESALPPAAELAHAWHAPLVLLRVTLPGAARPTARPAAPADVVASVEASAEHAKSYLDAQADRLRREGLRVETVQRVGSPAEVIVDVAGPDSLIVMSTHGRSGLQRLLAGSVALSVVRHRHAPILLVRPRGLRGEASPTEIVSHMARP